MNILDEMLNEGHVGLLVIATTNDRAKLTVKEALVKHDDDTAKMIEKRWKKEGYDVKVIKSY